MQIQNLFSALDIQMISIPILVWAVFAGFAIGILATYYNKAFLGKAIRAIIEKEAFGADKAMTAEALGFHKNFLILSSIRRGVLSRFVETVSEQGSEPRFYMNEELRIRAELRYSDEGTDLYVVIISLVILLILAFLGARYLPELLRVAGDLMS